MAWKPSTNRKPWVDLKPPQRLEFVFNPGCALVYWHPQYREWLVSDRCGRWWSDRIYRLVPVTTPTDDPMHRKDK